MNEDEPLAFFITWTVYGSRLQGDGRGWTRRRRGEQSPEIKLKFWRESRLLHDIICLDVGHRTIVEQSIIDHCEHRNWKLWAQAARTNHVHVVVYAPNYAGNRVRDQLKANCTGGLRKSCPIWLDRPVWTVGGDWECINTLDDLESVIYYVLEGQDRMGLDYIRELIQRQS